MISAEQLIARQGEQEKTAKAFASISKNQRVIKFITEIAIKVLQSDQAQELLEKIAIKILRSDRAQELVSNAVYGSKGKSLPSSKPSPKVSNKTEEVG